MSLEFDPNGPYMQEGYWGNHTPDDNCPFARRAKETSPFIVRIIREFLAEREPRKLATQSMNEFLALPNRELVRSLREGNSFTSADYPLGTIIHIRSEALSMGFKSKTFFPLPTGPWYRKSNYWGVVAQIDFPKPNETVLMTLSDGFVHFDKGWVEGSRFLVQNPNLEVGKAVHTRLAEDNNWSAIQAFKRVLGVDIWSIGKGVRKPATEQSLIGVLRKLAPHPG